MRMCTRALDNNCEISQNISHYAYGKYYRKYIKYRINNTYYMGQREI